jgi:hydroxyacylglutathione hydrolase
LKESVTIEQVPVGSHKNFAYLIWDTVSQGTVIIDPAWEAQKLLDLLQTRGLALDYIINTHAHYDHLEGNQALSEATGAKIIMSNASLAKKDIGVADGEIIKVGAMEMRFIHTPGHSPESMCIAVNDFALFTGDTLFIGECGRTDLPGGNAEQLYDSFQKLRELDPNLVVYPGHDYGSKPYSSLKEQLETNYTLAQRTKDQFVKFMSEP